MRRVDAAAAVGDQVMAARRMNAARLQQEGDGLNGDIFATRPFD
jgi:hypothetical protein